MSGGWRVDADGWSREVSGDAGNAPRAIRRHEFSAHDSFRIRELAELGLTAREIGERLNRDARAVERHGRRRWGIKFKFCYTAADVDMLRSLLSKNWTIEQIAQHFERDVGSVRNLAIRHHISIRPKKKIDRVSIRISGPLLRQIEAIAGPSGEQVGRYVRKVLRDSVTGAKVSCD
jgi:hypothetical protein